MRLTGLVIGHQGELKPVEIYGPSGFDDWEQCYHVFRTGCIMLNAVSLSTLDRYRDLIKGYSNRYGAKVWVIIYQADVRARLEHIERMRRRGAKLSVAGASTGERAFDASRPWDWSFAEAVADGAFWKRELEEPALLVLSRAGSLSNMVDGDAQTASSGKAAPSAPHPRSAVAAQGKVRPAQQQKAPRGRERQHLVDSAGNYTHNRSGNKLCGAFQADQCSAGSSCRDGTHQCNRCLAPNHGGSKCTGGAPKAPNKGNKGRGKGGGKDKSGGRTQY